MRAGDKEGRYVLINSWYRESRTNEVVQDVTRETQKGPPYAAKTRVCLRWIARASAWLLIPAIIVVAISGWGITHTGTIYKASFHLIDRGMADRIHRDVQLPMAVVLILHVLINLRLNLPFRSGKISWLFNSMFIILGVGLLIGVVYMVRYA
jgi:hypothetical protein